MKGIYVHGPFEKQWQRDEAWYALTPSDQNYTGKCPCAQCEKRPKNRLPEHPVKIMMLEGEHAGTYWIGSKPIW